MLVPDESTGTDLYVFRLVEKVEVFPETSRQMKIQCAPEKIRQVRIYIYID